MDFDPICNSNHGNSAELFAGYCENNELWENSSRGENLLSNMHGNVLNISAVVRNYEKFDTYAVLDSSGRLELRPSIALDLLLALQVAMNFTPNLKASHHWGRYDTNTSEWQGMIGSLLRNESDYAIGGSVDMPVRRTVIHFNVYINSWKFVAIFRTPNFSHDRLACLRPFDDVLWMATLSMIALLTLILLIMTFSHRKLNIQERPEVGDFVFSFCQLHTYHRFTVYDCIFWPANLICAKAVYHMPKKLSVRIALFSGSLAGLVLNVAYSGTLISFLSISLGSFKNFDQLLGTSFVFDTRSITEFEMLKASSSAGVIAAVSRIPGTPMFDDIADAKKNIMEGSYAFITHHYGVYEALNKNFSVTEFCLLGEVPVPMEKVHLGTMVRKNYPLKRVIDYQILRAKDFGLNNCWLRRHVPRKPFCVYVGQSRDGIPLSSILFSLWVFESGLMVSLVILVLEKVIHKLILS